MTQPSSEARMTIPAAIKRIHDALFGSVVKAAGANYVVITKKGRQRLAKILREFRRAK